VGPLERVAPRRGWIVQRASLGAGLEVRAIVARETEIVPGDLEPEALVDERPHERRRSKATTTSA
jgi:hypothetical protein